MLIDRRNFWKLHGAWMVGTAVAFVAALAWYYSAYTKAGRWPGGGSLPGLTLGILAAAIFLFEMALVWKKTRAFRTARWALSALTWMKAHIWLGLLTVPLVVLHSGGRLGGMLATLLVVVFAVVIASGLWGLALQNILPRMLLDGAPAETVYSQIDVVGRQYAAEAQRLVFLQCGAEMDDRLAPQPASRAAAAELAASGAARQARGAARQIGPQIKRSPHPARDLPQAIPAPAIEAALRESIQPYLATGASELGLLGSRARNRWFFDDLRLRVEPELRVLVGQLEDLCERRRQLNLQRQLHFWLHNWTWVHVPLSVALLILLLGHILFALRFG